MPSSRVDLAVLKNGKPTTEDVLAAAGLSDQQPVGERVLTFAVEDWLRRIESERSVLGHPELDPLTEDIRQAGEFVEDYAIAYTNPA